MADIFPRIDWGKHDTTLIFMVQKDCTTRQIAEALGGRCTRNAVIGRIHRLRLDGKLDLAPVKRDVPRQTMHQVPGLPTVGSVSAAPVPVVEKREGRQNPDKRIYKERQRQATNHAFSVNKNTQARIAALSATPLQERFAEGFDGQVGRVSLRKLEANHCRFPIDMPDGKIRYCGLDNLDGSSFCADHHARCYVGIPKPKANPRPLKLPNFTGKGGVKTMREAIAEMNALVLDRETGVHEQSTRRRRVLTSATATGRITHIEGYDPLRLMVATDDNYLVRVDLTAGTARSLGKLLLATTEGYHD